MGDRFKVAQIISIVLISGTAIVMGIMSRVDYNPDNIIDSYRTSLAQNHGPSVSSVIQVTEGLTEEETQTVSTPGTSTTSSAASVSLSTSAAEVEQKLLAAGYSTAKAKSLAMAWDICTEYGYTANCAIGLMANISSEGSVGVTEKHVFSRPTSHANENCIMHGSHYTYPYFNEMFRKFPASAELWGKNISEMGSNAQSFVDGCLQAGDVRGCGIGSVQWSGGRRTKYLGIVKSMCNGDYSKSNLELTEVAMMKEELAPTGQYYNIVARNAGSGTPEEWAKSFSEKYEVNATGSSARMQEAANINRILQN